MAVLIAVNDYRLLRSAEAFLEAVAVLAARVEREGEQGVLGYRFFADAKGENGRAVVRYTGPAAWLGHHDLSFGWPEMKALHGVATLERVSFLGRVSGEMRDWIAGSGLRAEILHYPDGQGFDR
ncbi:hypothetical protein ACSBLW_06500 [Thioclava sp. FR2]|uniref:hypothetical protein n=1 Tax=Thioclava sp. FR2 TaxID=3445780 RepID=UPI003EC05EFD